MKVMDWIKKNKILLVLVLVIVYLLVKDGGPLSLSSKKSRYNSVGMSLPRSGGGSVAETDLRSQSVGMPAPESAPQPDVEERMVVENSTMSCVVEEVRDKADKLISWAEGKGGYMVSRRVNQPGEIPYARVEIRVPNSELRAAMDYLRNISVKVVSETLYGRDVTDQYVDLQARLDTLLKTKSKFESILDQATKVEDILKVQRELTSLQSQIDNLKGRQEYLQKTAQNSRLTVHLSSDEWELPYVPDDEGFRPKVVFKNAVRSLVKTGRGLGKLIIWLGVYAPLWLPVVLIAWWLKKKGK